MIWGTIATALFDFAKDYFKRKKEIIDVKYP